MSDPFSGLAGRYLASSETMRGIVRHTLAARQLAEHIPAPPTSVIDVGGGAGHQAIPLARQGYEVTILDPSQTMLQEADKKLASEGDEVRRRVRLVEGGGEAGPSALDGETFEAVLCHGVLMYLDDPCPMVRALAALARPGAVISVLAKNASALAMRPALEGRYQDALAALEADRDLGRLGTVTRGDTVEGLTALFEESGIELVQWYGVRVFTDHLGDRPPSPNLQDILGLEWEACRRDPYRSVARLLHLVGRKSSGRKFKS